MKTQNTNPATSRALQADGRDGIQFGSTFVEHVKPLLAALARASLGIALLILGFENAGAQSWENSFRNPYVAAGYADQCTAYAEGRDKYLTGQWITFTNPQGIKVYPHGGLMVPYADESATRYRDSVPVSGSLVSWAYGDFGHVGVIERPTFDSSGKLLKARVSEQNWEAGKVTEYDLSASQILNRGATGKYKLVGYLNPNRAPSIGSITTSNSGGSLRVSFPIMDEDRRDLRILFALADQNDKVLYSRSTNVHANQTISTGLNGLRSGTTYKWYVWAWDFRGLRGVNSKTFKW